eukprot:GHVO01010069.1.p1 GENE.GHVO01010069.1~~GHVO01010069.1.p1  ORF type:complete len:222 (+),score=25.19 GHVO01010069.1:324-989(+)
MPLIYSVVARDTTVLAEYTDSIGNFHTVTRKLLPKLGLNTSKMSYTYDRYMFHCVSREGLTFLVMSTKDSGVQLPYAYLDEISAKFLESFAHIAQTAIALTLDSSFSFVMGDAMRKWNEQDSASGEAFRRVRDQIGDIQHVVINSIDKLLARGEKIGILVERSEALGQDSVEFRRQTRSYHRSLWWRNKRIGIMVGSGAAAILFVVAASFCGGVTFSGCRL